MLTLQQLITPPTEDQALATLLTILQQLGFQSTSWQSGSIQVTFLRMMARVWANLAVSVQQIAAGGFTTLAGSGQIPGTSPFLTLLAKYVYNVTRIDAIQTVGQIVLTSSAAAPVHTWASGDIIISDQPSGTAGANTFTVNAGGTLGPGSSLTIGFVASVAGLSGNIPTNSKLFLWTPLVGVTATNPPVGATGTWITTPGQDEESDSSLVARCIGKWSQLTYGNINGAYEAWARAALPALSRVSVASAPGNGNITIIGATATGPITGPQCTTIANYINGVTDGVGRRPINDIVSVIPATVFSATYNVNLSVRPDVFDSIIATASAALQAYISTIPIGGFKLVGSNGVVPYADLIKVVQQLDGVRSQAGMPSADIALSSAQIFTPAFNFTLNQVNPGI